MLEAFSKVMNKREKMVLDQMVLSFLWVFPLFIPFPFTSDDHHFGLTYAEHDRWRPAPGLQFAVDLCSLRFF